MKKLVCGVFMIGILLAGRPALAQSDNQCGLLPSQAELKTALIAAGASPTADSTSTCGARIVNRDGIVCAVAFTGADRGAQWPGSRVISAQKANTANSFSLPGLALSTRQPVGGRAAGRIAVRSAGEQPGRHRRGVQGPSDEVRHVATIRWSATRSAASTCSAADWRLYNSAGTLVGGIGVSGDTSCADHNIAWRTRHGLNMDFVPGGVGAQ